MNIETVNCMERDAFVATFGDIFERSRWVAQRAFDKRPFATADALHAAMVGVVETAPRDEQIALLRAHPDLAGKEARDGTMTRSSVAEQASAALDRLTADENARIAVLNAAYRARHGFPFIVAVRHYTKDGILHEFARRLGNDTQSEVASGLQQIFAITRLRIDALFGRSDVSTASTAALVRLSA